VAAAGEFVHALVAHLPELEPSVDQLDGLLVALDGHDDQVLDECLALFQGLPDLEFAVVGVEEVIDVLHVDLHEGDAD